MPSGPCSVLMMHTPALLSHCKMHLHFTAQSLVLLQLGVQAALWSRAANQHIWQTLLAGLAAKGSGQRPARIHTGAPRCLLRRCVCTSLQLQ